MCDSHDVNPYFESFAEEAIELIRKKEEELKEIVFCKCGLLKQETHDGEIECSVFMDLCDKEMNNNAFKKYYNVHHKDGGAYGDWGELAVWEFIQEIEKLKPKVKRRV